MRYALIILALISVPACRSQGEKPADAGVKPAEVTTLTVAPRDVPVSFEFVAQTQSSRQVNIQARVSGFLEKRVYAEGSMVKAGDVLFVMDEKPFKVQVDAQQAALARQQASAEVAKTELDRTRPLAAQNALSQKDLDTANGQYLSTSAAVEEAKARLETAKLNLSYCTIQSPVTGITAAAVQQEGSYITPQNSQLTTVAVLSPMWVNFSISENEMQAFNEQVASGKIRPPAEGNFVVDVLLVDGSLYPHKGRITFAAPSFNLQTGTFLLRASVDNPDGVLRPNAYVRVRLTGATRPSAVLLPQRTVQQGAEGPFVWVVDKEGKARPRPVRVGKWQGNDWFVSEGLQPGEQVIVDGTMALHAGAAVVAKRAPQGGQ